MKFGLLFRVQDPPERSDIVPRWQEALQAAKVAEEAGFDGVFLPEHHMMPDGYLSSPWAPLGALAALTERVDIGTTVHLLPFEHPIHVAEHGAMVDVLSNGRLRLGVGMGNFPPSSSSSGSTRRRQVSRFEEAIEIVQQAWAGEDIDHHGKHFDIKGPTDHAAAGLGGAVARARCRSRACAARHVRLPWATDPLHNLDVMKYWTEPTGPPARSTDHRQASVVLLRDGWVADSLEEVEKSWWPASATSTGSTSSRCRAGWRIVSRSSQGIEKEADFLFDRHRKRPPDRRQPRGLHREHQRFRGRDRARTT